jgi:phytoene dehydrogenase-like protein
METQNADAIVIGAGIGGMCAAARLSAAGMRVILLEKSPHLGGRCGHRLRNDALVTTGALMIPMGPGSAIRQAFDAVGAEMDMVDITGRIRYRLDHGDYDLPPGGGGLQGMIEFAMRDAAAAAALFDEFRRALFEWMPLDSISMRAWLDQYTDNSEVKKLFQGYCAALMGINLHEVPAGEFFRFLKYSSKGSRFGLARGGNGALMEALAAALERRGSELRCRAGVREIVIENRTVRGVRYGGENGDVFLRAPLVVSNTGPDRTFELAGGEAAFEKSYVARLREHAADAPIFHISFLLDRPLVEDFDGCLVFGNNRNLIYLEIPSAISPGTISPTETFLHTAYGAPSDALHADLDAEMENTLRELDRNFPGVCKEARFLVKARHSGAHPGMRRWAGYGMPVNTPIAGLYNVGDGCAPPGTIGTESAAASAKVAAEMIAARP